MHRRCGLTTVERRTDLASRRWRELPATRHGHRHGGTARLRRLPAVRWGLRWPGTSTMTAALAPLTGRRSLIPSVRTHETGE
ncbi:hypothetical protein CFP66_31425 [Pseudonocardia sp. MH-G8]|nr:hypothetical protein CFP66_31425 [Pseudonocardia sp. MH-G8]